METIIQHQEQIQYAEVYISDLLMLKNIFLQTQDTSSVNPSFGLPFLLVKKKSGIIAFASLILHENDKISFRVYHKKEMSEAEKRNFISRVENYFEKNNTSSFRNAEQLKSNISNMVNWLNF